MQEALSEVFTSTGQSEFRAATRSFESFTEGMNLLHPQASSHAAQAAAFLNEVACAAEVSSFFGHAEFFQSAGGRRSPLSFIETVIEGFTSPPTPPAQDTFLESDLQKLQTSIESTQTGSYAIGVGRHAQTWAQTKASKTAEWVQDFHESGYSWEKF